jgi:ABC-type transporter Mla maintaining outer membrane lipid asymmetry permease subunit MlaE
LKRLISLALIEIFVWLMLLFGGFVISKLILGISFGTSNLYLTLLTDGVRTDGVVGILLGW